MNLYERYNLRNKYLESETLLPHKQCEKCYKVGCIVVREYDDEHSYKGTLRYFQCEWCNDERVEL